MFRFQTRRAHYTLLIAAHLLLTLPNLGAHTLWDMDEGVNAEAAREMLESGNWITPTFNYELRTAKPALLYWLQASSFLVFGVNEWAARLPAVLCGLGTVLLTYELARRMFTASTGLLAGLVLASCVEFCLISHAATPDPPLLLFQTLVFFLYWAGSEGARRWWFVPVGAVCGLAVLTKGPVGVGLPGLVIVAHLAWTRRLDRLWDRRLLVGAAAFVAVAVPWYGLVALDTKGKWVEAFITNENINRFQTAADGHRGGIHYHLLFLVVLTAPWCAFLLPALWHGQRAAGRATASYLDAPERYRFLSVWILGYLVFFSLAATKLPNYVLPIYPAVAILIARMLDRWREGALTIPGWVTGASVAGGAMVGLLVGIGLLLASGTVPLPVAVKGFHPYPALAESAWVGLVPIGAAAAFGWLAWNGQRGGAIAAYALGAVLFLAIVAAVPTVAMNDNKVPRYFAEEVGLRQTDREIRLIACRWFRHSMVFYARREVHRIDDFDKLDVYFSLPRPAYLLVPADVWAHLSPRLSVPVHVIARRYDFYARREILVIANTYVVPEDIHSRVARGELE
jgi:4-amino-4-deoxy-L-arabinose transferase-like glycosyltransferase